MKKYMAICLMLAMMLALCACGSSRSDAPKGTDGAAAIEAPVAKDGLMVGYARLDITPKISVPLAGYGNTSMRMSNGYQTYLYTTCIAYSDGEDTILVFQNDLSGANKKLVSDVRTQIESKLNIPGDHVMISGTHTHSAPDMGSAEPSIAQYRQELIKTMLKAAEQALEDRKPVNGMYHGSTEVEGLNFIRHYTTTDPNVFKGDNLNTLDPHPVTGHLSEPDNIMQVVRIDREGGDDLVLINWQSHPHRGGGSKNYNITADIVGVMRDYVEKEVDGVLFAYYTGASGNLNPKSYIPELNITKDYWEQGDALGTYAVKVLNGEMTKLEGTNVQITGQFYSGEVNHTEDHLVNVAKIVQEEWKTNNDFTAACALANSYGLNSPYHAGAVISRANLGRTYDVEMYAFSVGDLSFVTAPYEMFDKQGVTIKEGSPFAATFVITCANDGIGYIPDRQGFEINCYEANNGKFLPGMGETLADEYVKMLEGLYATK